MKLTSKPKSPARLIIASIVGSLIIAAAVITLVMLTKKPAKEQPAAVVPAKPQTEVVPKTAATAVVPAVVPKTAATAVVPAKPQTEVVPKTAAAAVVPAKPQTEVVPKTAAAAVVPAKPQTEVVSKTVAAAKPDDYPTTSSYHSYLQVWVDKYNSNNSTTSTGRQLSLLWRNKEDFTTHPTVVKYQTRYRDTSTSGWSQWPSEWTSIDSSAMKLGIAPDSGQGKGSYNYATVDVDDVDKAYDIRLQTKYEDEDTFNTLYPLSPSTIELKSGNNSPTVNGTFHVDYTLLGGLGNNDCSKTPFAWARAAGAAAGGGNPSDDARKNYIINGNQWGGLNTYGYIIPAYSRYDSDTKTWYAITFALSFPNTWATTKGHEWLANNAQSTDCDDHGKRTGYIRLWPPVPYPPMTALEAGVVVKPGYDKYYTDSNNNENVKYRIGLQPEQIFNSKSMKALPNSGESQWNPITITIPEVA